MITHAPNFSRASGFVLYTFSFIEKLRARSLDFWQTIHEVHLVLVNVPENFDPTSPVQLLQSMAAHCLSSKQAHRSEIQWVIQILTALTMKVAFAIHGVMPNVCHTIVSAVITIDATITYNYYIQLMPLCHFQLTFHLLIIT